MFICILVKKTGKIFKEPIFFRFFYFKVKRLESNFKSFIVFCNKYLVKPIW